MTDALPLFCFVHKDTKDMVCKAFSVLFCNISGEGLYFCDLRVIINYLICVRTNKAANRSGEYMIKNNIEVDVKVKCIENGTTQAQLAETIGTTGQYVNRIIKKQDGVVNKTFVQMLEALGYDIELTYVKREV